MCDVTIALRTPVNFDLNELTALSCNFSFHKLLAEDGSHNSNLILFKLQKSLSGAIVRRIETFFHPQQRWKRHRVVSPRGDGGVGRGGDGKGAAAQKDDDADSTGPEFPRLHWEVQNYIKQLMGRQKGRALMP